MEYRQVLVLKGRIDDEVKIGRVRVKIERDELVVRMPPEAGFQIGQALFSASYSNGYMRFAIDAPKEVSVSHHKASEEDEV